MRKIAAILLLLALVFGSWFYFSPLYTLHQMKAAADAKDARKLSAYVDYPAVRSDLKSDLRERITGELAKPEMKGLQGLGAALATAMLDPMVDAMVSPQGIEAMFAGEAAKETSKGSPATDVRTRGPVVRASQDDLVIERGLNHFRVHGKDASKGAILFERHGLGWRMSGLDLPDPAVGGR